MTLTKGGERTLKKHLPFSLVRIFNTKIIFLSIFYIHYFYGKNIKLAQTLRDSRGTIVFHRKSL